MKINLLLLASLGTAAASCSMIVDSSTVGCNTDSDCAGSVRAVCSPQKVCVHGPECLTNTECVNASGQASICRKSDQKCAALTSDTCAVRAEQADINNDDTLWFGLITPRMNMGLHMEAGADLVRQQFAVSGNLPPATINGKRRPFGFVSCNNEKDLDKSLNHLINEVQVPAIVGSNLSSDVVTMLNGLPVQKGVLTLAPTAGAANISDIPSQGLFYRMSGSDAIAVETLAYVLRTMIEPQLHMGNPPVLGPGEPMRVAALFKNDAIGNSDLNAATMAVTFNGGKSTRENAANSNYKAINYGGDMSDPQAAAKYSAAVGDVIAFKPHVIFGFGSTEFSYLDKAVEQGWLPGVPKPYWLVVKGIAATFIKDIGTDEAWARRVYGAQPYVDKSPPAYGFYEQAFTSAFPTLKGLASVTATPSYFDAAYVLAYAVAANGMKPVTGANLAEAIRTRLTPPSARKVYVGSDRIFEVLSALGNSERVDLQGLTSALDFDTRGDVQQAFEVFCMQTDAPADGGFGKVISVKSAGMIYDPVKRAVSGTIANCPGP